MFQGIVRSAARAVSGGREGLWLGGTATVYADRLEFRPNAMNAAYHAGAAPQVILLADVVGVQVHRAFGTSIVDISHRKGTLSIRCSGADEFAHVVRSAGAQGARR